jgi:hypothetical protein
VGGFFYDFFYGIGVDKSEGPPPRDPPIEGEKRLNLEIESADIYGIM